MSGYHTYLRIQDVSSASTQTSSQSISIAHQDSIHLSSPSLKDLSPNRIIFLSLLSLDQNIHSLILLILIRSRILQ